MLFTIKNYNGLPASKVPTKFRSYHNDIKQAINTGLYNEDKEVKSVIDGFLSLLNLELAIKDTQKVKIVKDPAQIQRLKNGIREGELLLKSGKKASGKKYSKEELKAIEKSVNNSKIRIGEKPKMKQNTTIKTLPLSKINTDEKRFQNRKKLNETIVNNIVENFNETNLDPLIIWLDPTDNKYYLLAGHHRFAALKKLKIKDAPVKIANQDYPKEADAIRYAKEESNANRSLEKPYERAEIYRKYRLQGKSKAELETKAAIEGKNKSYVLNLSYLNPKGKTLQALIQFDSSTSVADTREMEKIADWIGQTRKISNKLTDAHENELFDFLTDKTASKRIANKVAFTQKVISILSNMFFDATKPLNIKRFKYESNGEKVYNTEVSDLQDKIKKNQESIDFIKNRFSNPGSKDYVDPNHEDYFQMKKFADEKILDYNKKINALQKELTVLFKNKSTYINAGSNQAALFGATTTKRKAKQKAALGYSQTINITDELSNLPTLKLEAEATKEQPAEGVFKEVTNSAEPSNSSRTKIKGVTSATERRKNAIDFEYFNFQGDLAQFLGKLEKKNKESLAINISGPKGSMKTRVAFQAVDMFIDHGLNVGFASLEEHAESALFQDKEDQYIKPNNLNKFYPFSDLPATFEEFMSLVSQFDAFFTDSWQKLLEHYGNINFDTQFRKAINGKILWTIFQETTSGSTRGGSKSGFDGDIILKVEKGENYTENFVYAEKNRYETIPGAKFYIHDKKLVTPEDEEIKPLPAEIYLDI
ncbi:ParB/RepB/Spo0J family partition protein [Bizionia myxarmorum]|uniref:ParB/RepB/Spo0J family partition protein n=1 Tax=Bizionia myxarmorum TaxID=291186 RepID=A0A5D0RB88_9FLAO|nr:ParB/RepB/Spo0J family partition protein [Bizionia myxarmorum]TYB78349.1 ParB/RepB/Spo0J family partition protein [Bizionia myxarmorum]